MEVRIKISKKYDTSYLTGEGVKFDNFIDVFEDKINGWYLDWADNLNKEEHAGFAALHIGFSYFEAISIFKNGEIGGSGFTFKNEFKKIFIDDFNSIPLNNDQIDSALELLYKEGRCGFYHSGMAKKGIALQDGEPTIKIQAKDIDENSGKVTKVRIDRHTFIERIKKDFESYINDLRNPSEIVLRDQFRESWNNVSLIEMPATI